MRRYAVAFAVACGLSASAPTAVDADMSVRLSNAQLTAASDVILIGRAGAAESRWVGRTLVMAVTVQIEESLKGGAAGQVEVLLPGGTDTTRRIAVGMTYPGAPTLHEGEQVFLFLTHSAEVGGYTVSGFAQGKFSIVTDQAGARRVSRDLRGAQLIEGAGISRGTVTLVPLSTFRRDIVNLISQP